MPEGIAPFLEHRSIRKFSKEPVDESLVAGLVAAAQSAATSSNLQLWSVISIQDSDRRQAMYECCSKQQQILDAPWFFAFLADHNRLRLAAREVGEAAAGLDYTEFFVMAVIDASLAAERMVCAAESIGLGICYIGALRNDAEAVARILHLPSGTFGVFGLCVGYPAESVGAEMKPRLDLDSVWLRETYPTEISVAAYDERMHEFYSSQKMKGDVTWSMRSGRRVDEHHLTGRDRLRDWLESQGFLRR